MFSCPQNFPSSIVLFFSSFWRHTIRVSSCFPFQVLTEICASVVPSSDSTSINLRCERWESGFKSLCSWACQPSPSLLTWFSQLVLARRFTACSLLPSRSWCCYHCSGVVKQSHKTLPWALALLEFSKILFFFFLCMYLSLAEAASYVFTCFVYAAPCCGSLCYSWLLLFFVVSAIHQHECTTWRESHSLGCIDFIVLIS